MEGIRPVAGEISPLLQNLSESGTPRVLSSEEVSSAKEGGKELKEDDMGQGHRKWTYEGKRPLHLPQFSKFYIGHLTPNRNE